jgi:LmbE family N-acetylglucosaminyl deacetylase
MIQLFTGVLGEIAMVGAHCDDIAIGMGGTLLTLAAAEPGLRVRALALSGAGSEREVEEKDALLAFCPGADIEVTILDVPDVGHPHIGNESRIRSTTFAGHAIHE